MPKKRAPVREYIYCANPNHGEPSARFRFIGDDFRRPEADLVDAVPGTVHHEWACSEPLGVFKCHHPECGHFTVRHRDKEPV